MKFLIIKSFSLSYFWTLHSWIYQRFFFKSHSFGWKVNLEYFLFRIKISRAVFFSFKIFPNYVFNSSLFFDCWKGSFLDFYVTIDSSLSTPNSYTFNLFFGLNNSTVSLFNFLPILCKKKNLFNLFLALLLLARLWLALWKEWGSLWR